MRALTGVDLDRLPEEQARGITIALGFTHLDLQGDAGSRRLSFVDVPGHERLIRTMIAGATGLDAVMLCVSAVEGAMPQTREHLAILQLLGVRTGLVVLTMADLVDEEMLELAAMDIEDTVAGTFLQGAPVLPVGLPPGGAPQGLDALRAALASLPEKAAPSGLHGDDGPLRLPIDRAFVQQGFGTVVTGTLRSGRVVDGEEVVVLPAGIRARVRGLQVHGEPQPRSEAGRRTALNLAGVERDDLHRGQVVCRADELDTTRMFDATCTWLPDAPPLDSGSRVRVLAGTTEVMAVIDRIGGLVFDGGPDTLDGRGVHLVQLRAEAPLVLLPGDRFVVRRESPLTTLGGGVVLDPDAPRARKRDRPRVAAELRALQAGDRTVLLERTGDDGMAPARAAMLGLSGVRLGDRVVHPDRAAVLQDALGAALDAWHRDRPLTPGAPRRDLHRGRLAHLSAAAFDAVVEQAARAGDVVLEGPVLRRPDFAVRPDADQQHVLDGLLRDARLGGLQGVPTRELLSRDADATMHLVAAGRLHRVGQTSVHADCLDALVADVRAQLAAEGSLTPGAFKDLTGLSRKHAIPLLEWLDARGITRRDGELRVPGPAAAST
ncbi:MAG: selenocysteine-specific translation elongation factor [Alphaproteobacteria bacterium]|nr:selenocysteine-specific translation elongation factor [Alphaproteobacteria bacterium]